MIGGLEHRFPNASDSYLETHNLKDFRLQTLNTNPTYLIQTLGCGYAESSRTSRPDFRHQIPQKQIWTESLKVLRLQILNPDLPNKSHLNHETLTLKDFSDYIH